MMFFRNSVPEKMTASAGRPGRITGRSRLFQDCGTQSIRTSVSGSTPKRQNLSKKRILKVPNISMCTRHSAL